MANELPESSCLLLPATGITGFLCYTWLFPRMQQIQPQVLTLMQQALSPPSHPSQPRTLFLNFQIIKFTSFVWENNFRRIELRQIKKQYVINSTAAKRMCSEKFHKVYVLAFQSWVTQHIHSCLLVTVRAQTRHVGEDAFQKLDMWGQAHHLPDQGSVTSYSSTKEERCSPHRELN